MCLDQKGSVYVFMASGLLFFICCIYYAVGQECKCLNSVGRPGSTFLYMDLEVWYPSGTGAAPDCAGDHRAAPEGHRRETGAHRASPDFAGA